MKQLILITVLVLNSSGLLAQKKDMTIHIKFDGGFSITHYLNILKKSETAIISSPNFIKMRVEELRKDTGFLNLRKNRLKYAVNQFKEKTQEFYDKYSIFDTTTVIIDLKADRQYAKALNLITTSSKIKLEKNHEKKDKVMDAGDATFTITTDNSIKNVYAEGLFEQRYPILANFVNLTYARLEPVNMKAK